MKEFKFFSTNTKSQSTKSIVVNAKFIFSASQFFEVPNDYYLGDLNPREAYEKLLSDCPGQNESFLEGDEGVVFNHMEDDLRFEYFDYYSELHLDSDGLSRYRNTNFCN